MTMGIIEAFTSSIGDELTDLFGSWSTRTTATVYPERQYQGGVNSADYNGTTTLTLTAGTFLVGVSAGMRVRILSGPMVGAEAIVQTRDSGVQVTLATAFPNVVAFTGASWEIVIDADDVVPVENATEFADADAPGRIVLDGIVYFYAAKTSTEFSGIEHDDGTGLRVSGVKQQHNVLAIVSDYSRAKSALDQYRRTFLVEFATGKDLDTIGRNLGVERPPELADDEVYRKLIMAVAYAPRGTVFAMEQVLDVLLGETQIASGTLTATGTGDPFIVSLVSGTFPAGVEGYRFRVKSGYLEDRTVRIAERIDPTHVRLNIPMEEDFELESWEITKPNWTLFEDLTLGSIHHGCQVFFRRTDSQEEKFAGKAFLDGEDERPLASTTTIDYHNYGHLRVASVRLKDEGGVQVIASGNPASNTGATSIDGKVVTSGNFPSRIKPGDIFQITSGGLVGRKAVVTSRDSIAQITLGMVDGAPNPSSNATGTIGIAFSGVSWQILRDKTNCRHYRPSAEVRLEHPNDAGTQTWTYLGASELTRVLVESNATYGQRLRLAPSNDVVAYQRILRITPESDADVEILLDVGPTLDFLPGSCLQIACLMSDGERVLAWGVRDHASGNYSLVGLIDVTTGTLINSGVVWSDVANTRYTPGMGAVRMVKTARGTVKLYKQSWQGALASTGWKLIDEVPYSSFPTVSAWAGVAPYAADPHEIVWGTLETGHTNQTTVKYIDWHVQNKVDFWNKHGTAETTADDTLEDVGAFTNADVGKLLRVKDFGALNTAGGNALGIWQVVSAPDADHVQLSGEQKWRGHFDLENLRALFVRGESSFVWPDHRGHSVEILDGVNAGVYPIVAILNPETLETYENLPLPATIADSVNWDSKDKIALRRTSHVVLLDTGIPDFTLTDEECSWRLVPNFPVGDTDVDYELIDVGTDIGGGGLTLRDAMPFAIGTVVSIHASKVLSAYLFHEREGNEYIGPNDYTLWPFYLFDGLGYVRTIMNILKAAGIHPDFDRLVEDETGVHILGDQNVSLPSPPQQFIQGSTGGWSSVFAYWSATAHLVGSVAGSVTTGGELVGSGELEGSTSGSVTMSGILVGTGELEGSTSGSVTMSGAISG